MEIANLKSQVKMPTLSLHCRWSTKLQRVSGNVFAYLSGLIGSKSKLGYHYHFEGQMSKRTLQSYMPFAYINASTYNNNTTQLSKLGYEKLSLDSASLKRTFGFESYEHNFLEKQSGVVVSLFEKGNEVVVSIGALGASEGIVKNKSEFNKHWKQGVASGAGNILAITPGRYLNTHQFVQALLQSDKLKSKKVVLTGNCIGGSIASYISLKEQLPAVCINPLPLGAGMQRAIGDKVLSKADQLITNITIKSDWASDFFCISLFDRAISFLGMRTPGVFGHRYSVPTQFRWNIFASHSRVLTSFKAYLSS